MNIRLTLTVVAVGAALGACTTTAKLSAVPTQAEAALSPDSPIGHPLAEIVDINGPPTDQRDLPDGRRMYQWQSSSISATVAPTRKGEIKAAAVNSTTCFYTLYAKPDDKGVVKVVAADEPGPGCMKLAMVGQVK